MVIGTDMTRPDGLRKRDERMRTTRDMQHAYDLGFSYTQSIDVSIGNAIRLRGITHLLLLPERQETDTRDLDDLEADTGDITLGLATATETGDEDLVVLVDEVQATIVLGDCRVNNELHA